MISSAMRGRKAGEPMPPLAAMTFATSRWKLTAHRSSGAAVSREVLAGRFGDGIKEIIGCDKLGIGGGGTASELVVVHSFSARQNEEFGDG